MQQTHLIVQGAREHNLKNVDVTFPRDAVVVITGLSGSGKSSLAFDTIFAEGQRKYVESLSAYARQFLDQMQKPDVDHIEGLSPAISIEQRTAGSNPRSIVATTTEIYDYLRLLYASIGIQHCPKCGKPLTRQSAEDIINLLMDLPAKTRVMILTPYVDGRKGEHLEVFQDIRNQGFVRARVDGKVLELDDVPALNKKTKHSIDAVVDRLMIDGKVRSRLADSVELALRLGKGRMTAMVEDGNGGFTDQFFSEEFACIPCGLSFEKLENRHFSFNSPYGACPRCAGLGSLEIFDEALLVPNPELSLEEGAVDVWKRGGRRVILWYKKLLRGVAEAYGVSMDTPYHKLPAKFRRVLMEGSGDEIVEMSLYRGGRKLKYDKPFEGVIPNLERRMRETESDYTRQRLREYMAKKPCPACGGARLKEASLACTVADKNIHQVCTLSVKNALAFFEGLTLGETEARIVKEVLKEIQHRLRFLNDVGLDYLTLDRESGSLSGGEAQRIRLASQVGSGLMGVLYVLDEPSIGLHQRDNLKLIHTMKGLRDSGNTVLVVEHDEETIREADYVIDMGPLAGRHGGEVVFSGLPKDLLKAKGSLTADYLNGKRKIPVPETRKKPSRKAVTIQGALENNLKNVDVKIPLGVFTCVTGVSGSGKSTLVDQILKRALFQKFFGSKDVPGKHKKINGLQHIDKVIVIDQSPIGRTPRSNPATYTGAFNLIRDLFAKLPASQVRGYGPGRFSFNVKGGRCESCKGDGLRRIEMHFLPDVYVTCEVCEGRRYNRETLEVRYKGKNISDVLDMTVEDALGFFEKVPGLQRKLQTLVDVGLGYLQVGQPATTLSGGEAQRVKLATELSKRDTGNTLYILDEPTTGLHFADVDKLLEVLLRLRDAGNSLLVIEHNLDVIKTADWIIDLGPEGGEGGGELIAAGTPEEVAQVKRSYTGQFLAEML
ncbi:MAG: excinuclease ABC subunit UvrA [Verrucomicrobia bacterium]|nr:excinuclease ABC subunit UvrA [Verrucomicrobiota bacterium]MCH8528103.1 excinuclease ABC subunit UvrA [Kiritimatiellia bacterium]